MKASVKQAVKFNGSTTQINAINNWMKTGTYTMPQFITADLRHSFTTEIGNLKVNLGDYIMKSTETGEFWVLTSEQFGLLT